MSKSKVMSVLLCKLICRRCQLSQRLGKPSYGRKFSSSRSQSPLKIFQKFMDERPMISNSLLGGFFMCAGFLSQQVYFNPNDIKWKQVSNNLFTVYHDYCIIIANSLHIFTGCCLFFPWFCNGSSRSTMVSLA